MNPINNIKKLFSKDFVESPLLESFDMGKIHISTGQLVASDPLITPDKEPFEQFFPLGDFPVIVHKERETNCVAYVEIVFQDGFVQNWNLATTKGQHTADLAEGEVFGYPVESGMGCFMDIETQSLLNKLEREIFEKKADDFEGIYAEFFHNHFYDGDAAVHQFALLQPDTSLPNNIAAFETGYGEGFYATYIGYDDHNNPVKIITEFIEIIVD